MTVIAFSSNMFIREAPPSSPLSALTEVDSGSLNISQLSYNGLDNNEMNDVSSGVNVLQGNNEPIFRLIANLMFSCIK